MRRMNGHVGHLEEQAPVANYAPHADDLARAAHDCRVDRTRQATCGGLFALGTQASLLSEAAVVGDVGNFRV